MANQAPIWTQGPHGIILTCSTNSKDPKYPRLTVEFPSQLINFDCILKSQTLTFWSKSRVKIHFSSNMPNHETCSPRNQNLQIRVWNENFSWLRIFLSYEKPKFFPTLPHFLTKIHLDSNKSQNMKVVACCIIYNFDSHQHYELLWTIWSSLNHNSTRNLIRSSKGQNGHF